MTWLVPVGQLVLGHLLHGRMMRGVQHPHAHLLLLESVGMLMHGVQARGKQTHGVLVDAYLNLLEIAGHLLGVQVHGPIIHGVLQPLPRRLPHP
jgi:hypothetical protein